MQQKKTLGVQPLERSFRSETWCPPPQLSWTKFRDYIRQCIIYSPETFSRHNELCRRAEVKIQAQKPGNPIESGLKALDAENILPQHDIGTSLANAYFSTWERLYRVIHVPSFWKHYHDTCVGIRQSSLGFRILTLVILVLGQRAMVQGSIDDLEAIKANNQRFSQWTQYVESYCFLLIENKRLDLTAIQTLCLFSLYKATTCDRNEALRWTQRLVKRAVQTNLHVDSSKFNSNSPFEVEIRRRLWATILEIDLQVSIEHGNSILWTANIEHKVLQPSNLNNVKLNPHSTIIPLEK